MILSSNNVFRLSIIHLNCGFNLRNSIILIIVTAIISHEMVPHTAVLVGSKFIAGNDKI